MTAPATTALSRLAIGPTSTLTQRLDFVDFALGVEDELKDLNGTRGKYTKDTARVRKNMTRVQPTLKTHPTSLELSVLLPWALGGTPTGSGTVTYPLGDTPPTQFVGFDPNAGAMWLLSGVAVDEAKFKGTQGEALEVEFSMVGQDYSVSGFFPSLSLDLSTQPFLFTDCVLTIGSDAVQAKEFELSIANGIDRSRFFNSRTLTTLNKLTRKVSVRLAVPFGPFTDLFGIGAVGAAVNATFTNGNAVLSFALGSVRFNPKSPESPFQQEVMLTLEGEAYSPDGTTESLITTLAVGP